MWPKGKKTILAAKDATNLIHFGVGRKGQNNGYFKIAHKKEDIINFCFSLFK